MDGSASGGAATRRSPSGLRRSRACRSTAAATRRLPARGAYGDHSLQELPDSSRLAGAAIGRLEAQGVGRLTARIRGYDLTAALAVDGVVGAITGEDVLRHTKPFGVGVTAPVHYYCAATDKARFVGEPVAVVVAKSRYVAEDAAELVRVSYEPLPAVVDPERALEPDAPVLHDAVGTNLAAHRHRPRRLPRARREEGWDDPRDAPPLA